jgi:NitT/TauT family transport system substrate-binding protein
MSLFVAACGDGEAEDTTTTAAPATTTADNTGSTGAEETTTTTEAPREIVEGTILLGGKVVTWAPAYCAKFLGHFEDEGLDIDLVVAQQGAAAAMAALISGDALSAMTGAPAGVAPVREGAPTKLLFVASGVYGIQVTARNDFLTEAGVGPESSLEDRVRALAGATLGIYNPGDSVDQFWRLLLPQYGINPDTDVEIVSMQNAAGQFAALANGQLDAMGVSPPGGAQAESEGFGTILIDATEVAGLDRYPYLVGSANTSDIEERPEAIIGIVRAIATSMEELKTNPDACRPLLREEFSETDDASFDEGFDRMLAYLPESPVITQEYYDSLVAFAEAQGNPLGLTYDELVAGEIASQALGG